MGDHLVHIILKKFLNILISLAVTASLGINNSLILVLYLAILAIFSSHSNGDLVSLVGKCSLDNFPNVFKVSEHVAS